MLEESVENQGKLLNMSEQDYLNECKKSLTSEHIENYFFYTIENEYFLIKKQLDSDSCIKFRLASIQLKKVDFMKTVGEILDALFIQNKNNILQIVKLREEKISLEKDNTYAVTCLKKMVEEKKCLEETLYCKFLKLLNSKKEYFTNTLKRYTSGETSGTNNEITDLQEDLLSENAIFDMETDIDDVDTIKLNESKEIQNNTRYEANWNDEKSEISKVEDVSDFMEFFDKPKQIKNNAKCVAIYADNYDNKNEIFKIENMLNPVVFPDKSEQISNNTRCETHCINIKEKKSEISKMDDRSNSIEFFLKPEQTQNNAKCVVHCEDNYKKSKIPKIENVLNHVAFLNESEQIRKDTICETHCTDRNDENKISKVENLLNSMAFLDPTIPFSDL